MDVLFLCGSIEPGQNGVGDYTRVLTKILNEKGIRTILVGLHEAQIPDTSMPEVRLGPDISLEFRLSYRLSWKDRITFIDEISRKAKVKAISIQFVPFSFHNKGLPFEFVYQLGKVKSLGVKWHIMFHELWVADSYVRNIKEGVLKWAQKMIIKKVLTQVCFSRIDTSNVYYRNMLHRLGFASNIAPLFSNLPKGDVGGFNSNRSKEDKVTGVLFGKLHAYPDTINKIAHLKFLVTKQLNKELHLIHIGNASNSDSVDTLKSITQELHIPLASFGFLDAKTAANVIAQSDFGLSNYPTELIGKSGSIAAMLFNGLPVILLDSSSVFSNDERAEIQVIDKITDLAAFISQPKDFVTSYAPNVATKSLLHTFCNWIK